MCALAKSTIFSLFKKEQSVDEKRKEKETIAPGTKKQKNVTDVIVAVVAVSIIST